MMQVSLLLNMQQDFEQFYTLLRHSASTKNLTETVLYSFLQEDVFTILP